MTEGGEEIVVRRMSTSDIEAVVELQVASLTGSIVTGIGPRFLAAFRAAALQHGQTRAFVAVDADRRIAGFVTASTDVHAFNAHVKPKILVPLLRALASPRGLRIGWNIARGVFEGEPQPSVPAELLLVAAASYRRRGIAQRLVTSLEDAFRREVVARYRVAVRSHLAVARAFYLATGFEPEQELTVLGQPMTYLTRRVTA